MNLTADSPVNSSSTSSDDFASFLDAELDCVSDGSPDLQGEEEKVAAEEGEREEEEDDNDDDEEEIEEEKEGKEGGNEDTKDYDLDSEG